jgi:hypothetical protein
MKFSREHNSSFIGDAHKEMSKECRRFTLEVYRNTRICGTNETAIRQDIKELFLNADLTLLFKSLYNHSKLIPVN